MVNPGVELCKSIFFGVERLGVGDRVIWSSDDPVIGKARVIPDPRPSPQILYRTCQGDSLFSGLCPGGKVGMMEDVADPKDFDEIVEWAYRTLPRKIRSLPDFPGIQVLDEPPPELLQEMGDRRKWSNGTEFLGLYSGIFRTKRSFYQLKYAPDLIFVFRGPILRYTNRTKGDLRAEVKQTVWHEVAHWLGFETEEQVKALGL
jgi:predicted Zn-dependent protease with MMP-like domain